MMIHSIMIYKYVVIPNVHYSSLFFLLVFLNDKAMHSILGTGKS